jgi:hypothetical protein
MKSDFRNNTWEELLKATVSENSLNEKADKALSEFKKK